MMRTMVKKTIKILGLVQALIFATYFISPSFYANVQVSSMSSFFIMLGSFYAYKKMIKSQVLTKSYEDDRDTLDIIDDPHGLYDETPINDTPAEELDLREIVKEEKAKIKTFSFKSIKHGARGSVSLYRIFPYIFLILGFISLKNNEVLDLGIYLPSLLLGIVVGSLVSKDIAAS